MSIFSKVADYLERPNKELEIAFHDCYLKLSEDIWLAADQNSRAAIEEALTRVLAAYHVGTLPPIYAGKSDEEINDIFIGRLIDLYKEIPDYLLKPLKTRLDEHLRRNLQIASSNGMKVPDRGKHLLMEEYYNNYEKAKSALLALQIQTNSFNRK